MANNAVVVPEEQKITIVNDGREESYLLSENPPASSSIVQYAKKEILQNLDLTSVLVNLDNAAGLMYVAYNALAGTKIQSKMQGLQKELLDLCDDSIVAIQSFKSRAEELALIMKTTYKYLTKCQEELAIKQLMRCSACAKVMADTSEALAKRFSQLSTRAENILEQTQDEQAVQYQKVQKLKEDLAEFEAQQVALIEKQKGAQEMVEQLNASYQEETERLRKLEDDEAAAKKLSMGLQIVGAVLSPAISIISCVAGTGKSEEAANKKNEDERLKKEKEAKTVAEEEGKAVKLIETKQAQIDKTKKEIEEIKEKIEEKTKSLESCREEETEAINKEIQTLKTSLSEKESDLKEKNKEHSKISETADAIAAQKEQITKALGDISAICTKQAEESKSAADATRNQRKEIFKQKMDMEKENRNMLASMAEFAKRIENTKISGNAAESAVETLQVAIKCLKQIVTALATGALFWRSVEQYCSNLAKGTLLENIKDIKELSKEDRLEIYYEADFMESVLNYMGKWVALHSVCTDYLTAANKVRGAITDNIQQSPSIEEAKVAAPELAKKIMENVAVQLKAIDGRCKMLEDNEGEVA